MEGQLTAPGAESGDMVQPLLEARGIIKQYPGVTALNRVDFDLRAGEIHALMGENGAGKTTLIRILTGATAPHAGTVRLDGKLVRMRSPAEAQAFGIATVYQEIDLIPYLSVAENLLLGRQPMRWGLIRGRDLRRRARQALARLGLNIDVESPVHSLSIAMQQMVAIARALDGSARILVLDEPTSSLDSADTARLFSLLRELKSRGLGIIFITHFIDQVFAISDRISILRNGLGVGCHETNRLTRLKLVSLMLGRDMRAAPETSLPPRTVRVDGERSILEAKRMGREGAIAPFDLVLGRGEVVGLAGLLGSGRSEAVRLIFGADRAQCGEIRMHGRPIRRPSPRRSLRAGVGFVPEDRKQQALAPNLSVEENLILAVQARRGVLRRLGRADRRKLFADYVRVLGIVAPGPRTPIRLLSGGNQQKVILARWLATQPEIMILDEPTRGIDIGAKAEVERIMAGLRERGLSMLFISSELDEIVRDSTRILVLRDRRIIGELESAAATPERIMEKIAGVEAS